MKTSHLYDTEYWTPRRCQTAMKKAKYLKRKERKDRIPKEAATQKQLLDAIRNKTGYATKVVKEILDEYYTFVEDELLSGRTFVFGEIGKLAPILYPPRKNPSHFKGIVLKDEIGDTVVDYIPPHYRLAFFAFPRMQENLIGMKVTKEDLEKAYYSQKEKKERRKFFKNMKVTHRSEEFLKKM